MRRLTVTLEDSLVAIAQADVAAGRAPSVSAWVASAIRAKALARAELVGDLQALEQRDPTPPEVIASIATSLELRPAVVESALGRDPRRAKARRAR